MQLMCWNLNPFHGAHGLCGRGDKNGKLLTSYRFAWCRIWWICYERSLIKHIVLYRGVIQRDLWVILAPNLTRCILATSLSRPSSSLFWLLPQSLSLFSFVQPQHIDSSPEVAYWREYPRNYPVSHSHKRAWTSHELWSLETNIVFLG